MQLFQINKISKYLTYFFIKVILMFTLGISVIILLIDFSENIRKYSGSDKATTFDLLGLTLLKIPSLILETSIFIVLFSCLFCIRNIVLRRELDIFRACGISIWKFLTPFLIISFAWGVFLILVVSPLSVYSLKAMNQIENSFKNNEKTNIIEISDENVWMIINGENKQEYFISSKSIHREKDSDRITLYNLVMFEISNLKVLNMLKAQRGVLDTNQMTFYNLVYKEEGAMLPEEQDNLVFNIKGFSKNIASFNTESTQILLWNFPEVINGLKQVNLAFSQHVVYFYNMLTMPILLLAMVFISARFSLVDVRRGGNINVIFYTILVGIFIFFLNSFLGSIGNSGVVDPILMIFFSKGVILLFSISLLFAKEGL